MESTCLPGMLQYQSIVYYSHLIPVLITVFLTLFILIKSKFSFISSVFSVFTVCFCLWLVSDTVSWLALDYNKVSFTWAFLDYINILFYLAGAYFFVVLAKGKDLSWKYKIAFIILSLPAWWITVTNQSISHFNQAVCEAENNQFLTNYKLFIESLTTIFIIGFSIRFFRKVQNKQKRKQVVTVALALLLFFLVFSFTEYISSETGIYEINLYSLFVLPVFLVMMIYSITSLEILKIKNIGTQLLAYILVIMVGSQFFFLENTTDQALTVVTFVLALVFGVLLVRSSKREVLAREMVEKKEKELEIANQAQSDVLHFMSHQVKGFLTNTKAALSMVLEGDYGPVPKPVHDVVEQAFISEDRGVTMVQSFLNASRIDEGSNEFIMTEFDLKKMVEEVIRGEEPIVKEKGLTLVSKIAPDSSYLTKGDHIKFREVVFNLIDNAVRYTPAGTIEVNLWRFGNMIRFSVKDSGVGIPESDRARIFTKYGYGKESRKVNVHSNGLGLYLVKNVVETHKGKVWYESEGAGKGTTFIVEVKGA